MVRKNELDRRTDKLKERLGRLMTTVSERYKNTRPYRKEPVSDAERIQRYLQWAGDPQLEMEMRQQFGNEGIDTLHRNMRELINRGQANGRVE